MKRFMAVLIATAFLSTAGSAFAQTTNSELSNGWVGDEGVTPAGQLQYCYDRDGPVTAANRDDPSCAWATDNNGLTAALGSNVPPVVAPVATDIINLEWRTDAGA